MACALAADYLEHDAVLSKDNVPVVLPDAHIDTASDVAKRSPEREREDGR
jgi:glycerophosphoryl diester phosphodiesterase